MFLHWHPHIYLWNILSKIFWLNRSRQYIHSDHLSSVFIKYNIDLFISWNCSPWSCKAERCISFIWYPTWSQSDSKMQKVSFKKITLTITITCPNVSDVSLFFPPNFHYLQNAESHKSDFSSIYTRLNTTMWRKNVTVSNWILNKSDSCCAMVFQHIWGAFKPGIYYSECRKEQIYMRAILCENIGILILIKGFPGRLNGFVLPKCEKDKCSTYTHQ